MAGLLTEPSPPTEGLTNRRETFGRWGDAVGRPCHNATFGRVSWLGPETGQNKAA